MLCSTGGVLWASVMSCWSCALRAPIGVQVLCWGCIQLWCCCCAPSASVGVPMSYSILSVGVVF